MALESPQYERSKGVRMRRDVLMLITGAFTIGGGVAAVNRMVMKALSEWSRGECNLTILDLHEPIGTCLDTFYADEKRTVLKAFNGSEWMFALETWRSVLSRRFDLILVDHAGLGTVLLPFEFFGLLSYVVFCFGLEVSPKLLHWRRKAVLHHAARRLAISATTHSKVIEQFPKLPVDVCELALDPKIACPPGEVKRIPPRLIAVSGEEKQLGIQVILCVGRMWSDQRHKGQDALIAAMPKILCNFPLAQLVLAGNGDLLDELKAFAQKKGVANSVFLPGFVSASLLSQLYENCYVFAMPSKAEGFGLVYLEAMNWAKPCIAGRLDAARDVIVDHETGLLLDEPHNPKQIADAVILLLSNPQLAERMGRAGRKRLEERYLFRHFCNRFYRALGWV